MAGSKELFHFHCIRHGVDPCSEDYDPFEVLADRMIEAGEMCIETGEVLIEQPPTPSAH